MRFRVCKRRKDIEEQFDTNRNVRRNYIENRLLQNWGDCNENVMTD